ncbi:MAG TPA: DUF177 domain-containing protein, partial [Ilumatobacteraceae bacterium]|nr:DUF177 domain-containing protein [Ilumatobacteraceae bacterium]
CRSGRIAARFRSTRKTRPRASSTKTAADPAVAGRPFVVNANELLRRPGSERTIDTTLTAAELGLTDERFAPDDPVHAVLHLESTNDGVVVSGSIEVPWHGHCRRCLIQLDRIAVANVDELYQQPVTDPDAFEIVGEQLDLSAMVRELALLDAPHDPLCRHDCAGLCRQCGIDRNNATCECVADAGPSPWDALDALREQLGDAD